MIVPPTADPKAQQPTAPLSRNTSQRTQPPTYEDAVDHGLKVHVLPSIEDSELPPSADAVDIVLASEPVMEEKAPRSPGSPVQWGTKSFPDAHSDYQRLPSPTANVSCLTGLFERLKLRHAQKHARRAAKRAARKERREARRAAWRAEWEERKKSGDGGCCAKGKGRAEGCGNRRRVAEQGLSDREGRKRGCCA
ncbi:hypothetical protein CALVIDRAFT_344038 [Calocera viscosa TUFC12733]|uniref:Uncharacterized protein n=1 Tax=Calocera viscosa (strain TUFC12733) TaxID=1330018 RepID=A0A167HCR7_CALVF|nr:hypothetical protein CALVIDRAFT_344038 [Calocera viscosa TUFC12733]